jgi:VWFA-related protein
MTRLSFLSCALPLLLAFCCPLPASAQETSNAPASQNEPAPAFRSETNLIVVRVIVRDAKGNPISGLSKSDFQLLDNKKAQAISYFSAEEPSAANQFDANEHGAPANPSSPAAAGPQRFTAIFFDDYHLAHGNLGQLRDAAKRYLAQSLDRGARVAIYTASGKLHVEFTNDRVKLEQAISQLQFDLRFQPSGECPPMTEEQAEEIAANPFVEEEAPAPTTGPAGGRVGKAPVNSGPSGHEEPESVVIAEAVAGALRCPPEDLRTRASFIAKQNDLGAETSLTALNILVRRMAETPGSERTIAMVSEGFLNKSLQPQMDALIDRALRAKVIINALDAQGLFTAGGTEASAAVLSIADQGLQNAYEKMQMRSGDLDADVLAEAAEGTGGIFIKNSNGFEDGLAKMTAPYTTYVLGFSPGNIKFDGKFHTLNVKLVNPAQLTVQARRGYFASNTTEDAVTTGKEEMESALFSREDLTGLPVQISAKFVKVNQQTAKVSVTVDTDMHSVRFRREGSRNLDDLTVMVALFDADGNYVTGKNQVINLRLSDAELTQVRGAGGEALAELDVKPGNYVVRAVLRESASQHLGAASQRIEIP